MATTTNYSWTTPDDTDLVKDGAAAIRTLGSSVDTTTKNLNPSTTLGDIEYRSSTANTNTRLGIGSTGNILTVVGGVPAWSAPAGGGKVLQVVQASYSTEVVVASTSYTDTGLTLSITPSSATSKVLVIVNQQFQLYRNSADVGYGLQLLKGASSIFDQASPNAGDVYAQSVGQIALYGVTPLTYLDSPATTSSTTYKTQGKLSTTANNAEVKFQQASTGISTITLLEIGA
jgi:hypothetical protein